MKVAVVQLVSGDNIELNIQRVCEFLEQARASQADLVVFPEVFLTFAVKKSLDIDKQRFLLDRMAALASEHGLWLVAGTLPLNLGTLFSEEFDHCSRPHSATIIFDDEGRIRGKYSKIHLFDADVNDHTKSYRESDRYACGDRVVVVDSPWGGLGLAICYDLRFPELFIRLSEQGSHLIVVPSAFTEKTGEAHWEILVRARAIETQSFVLAANQGGEHSNGQRTWGNSMIVNPWGEIVSKADKGEVLLIADIDLQMVNKVRQNMPIMQHRRLSKR